MGFEQDGAPTLDDESVRLLRVVDLPDDGLPTSPMSGSRGMVGRCVRLWWRWCCRSVSVLYCSVHAWRREVQKA